MSGDPAISTGYQRAVLALGNQGYHFDSREHLIETKTGKRFVFKDQQHYDDLGQIINEYIYYLLETQCELKRINLQSNGDRTCRGFCFASDDVSYNQRRLLVLIHGTGVVRAGQWSRKLIINSSLESGSQIPYIKHAKANNWAVIVMNTNQRNDRSTHGTFYEGYSPEDHACIVWNTAIKPSPAQCIAIVAHSYGGQVTSWLLQKFNEDFKKRVVAVALTDAFCTIRAADKGYFNKVARNWVTSSRPINENVGSTRDCCRVSAGTMVHEETSWKSMQFVFAFVKERFEHCLAIPGNADTSMSGSLFSHVDIKGDVARDVGSALERPVSSAAKTERKHCTMGGDKPEDRPPVDPDMKRADHMDVELKN